MPYREELLNGSREEKGMVKLKWIVATGIAVWLSLLTIVNLVAQNVVDEAIPSSVSANAFLVHHASDVQKSLAYLGSPLSMKDCKVIHQLSRQSSSTNASIDSMIQHALDSYCIAFVEIESDKNVTVTTNVQY
jgi:hypothetical protein